MKFVLAYYHAMQQASIWLDHYFEAQLKATTLEAAIPEAQEKWKRLQTEMGTYTVDCSKDSPRIPAVKRPRLRQVNDFPDVHIA